jgi:PAS domain S-box-containing protein
LNIMQPSDLGLCSAVVEQAPDALIFADREGTIQLWNARAEAIFGYAAGEAIGRSLDLIIPENLRAAHWRGYHQAITLGHAKTDGQALVTRATHKLGNKLYVELAFGIIQDSQQNTLGAVATGRDITQRYVAERAQRAR